MSDSEKAATLPWRNITREWNLSLEDYRRYSGRHRHGTLRGSRGPDFPRGMDNKYCAILVVVDLFQGEPIKLHGWGGYPDWWDLTKIIARPYDAVFRGVKGKTVAIDEHLSDHVERLVALHNASLVGVKS